MNTEIIKFDEKSNQEKQDFEILHAYLQEGVNSSRSRIMDETYFEDMKKHILNHSQPNSEHIPPFNK